MSERMWFYQVPGPREASEVIKRIDRYSLDKIVGLGVAAKGYLDEPETFIVFVTGKDLSPDEVTDIEATLSEWGKPLPDMTYQKMMSEPMPHMTTSGLGKQILPVLKAQYPDAGIEY
jgi:hypothetical protein